MVQERLQKELIDSELFKQKGLDTASNRFILKTQIKAFCSQVVGFLIGRVAGITSIKFSIEQNGKVILEKQIERVVTDDSPEYSGIKVTFIEQAMRQAMADSLRLVLNDLLKEIEINFSKFTAQQ